jgi:hypothetical protein
MRRTPPPFDRHTRGRARLWLALALAAASVSLTATGQPAVNDFKLPPALARPAAAAASALRSALDDAARPALQAASAVRNAATAVPRPAAIAASAASAVQAVVEQALQSAVTAAPAASAAPVAAAAPVASAPRSASGVPAPAPIPAPSAALSAASAPAACMRVSEFNASCGPGLQLVFRTVALPPARQDMPYKPRLMVQGGVGPYRIAVTEGHLPAGLGVAADGYLRGMPTAAGPNDFTLQISDSSSPALTARQAYSLRVAVAPRPPAASAAAQIAGLAPEDAQALASTLDGGTISSWVLLPEDLDTLLPTTTPPADAAASAPKPTAARLRPRRDLTPPTVADPDQVRDMLTPLLHIDYPTRTLFEAAVEARRCAYYSALVAAAAKKKVADMTIPCPPDKGSPAATGSATTPAAAASAPIPLPEVYAGLLPDALKAALTAQAEWIHPLSSARPVNWSGDGCGCVAVGPIEQSYGIFPFWQARDDELQKIRFSLFNRIGYLGVQLTDTGDYRLPGHAVGRNVDFVRVAQRFGTQVDLVIHRAEWTQLLSRPNQDQIIERAASEAMRLVDTPLDDWFTRVKHVLLPFWGEPTHLFDGLTIFFDNAPTDKEGAEKFGIFYGKYVQRLIGAMRRSGRDYALNIVVPDHQISEEGAYGFGQLMSYLDAANPAAIEQAAEPAASAASSGTGSLYKRSRAKGNVSVTLLVMVREPTGNNKKALRARVDGTETIQGHRRIEFLDAVSPLIFHSGSDPQAAATSLVETRLDLDLAYFKWQYGGVGFWPLPLGDAGNGKSISDILAHNYVAAPRSALGVCDLVCPNRSWFRLAFMALALTGVAAIGLYVWVCKVHQIGRRYILFLWLEGIATFLVGSVLYSCDPNLFALRTGNIPLAVLLLIAVGLGMYYSLKPRITPP